MNTQTRKKFFFWIVLVAALLLSAGQIFTTSAATGSSAPLVINELVADNGAGLTDEDGEHSDWIELYNRSSLPINLAGWALTDDPNNPAKWTFPDTTLGSHQYLVVFASGKNRQGSTPGAALHTNFKLQQEGDFLGLHNVLEDKFVDVILPKFPLQFRDVAYGRYGTDLAYGYLTQPTPGGPNNETQVWAGMVAPVEFSAGRGFYEAPFTLQLSTATPGATIRYTLDGSEPTETTGQVYSEPIPVETTAIVRAAAFKSDFLPSSTDTQSYVFLQDVLTQPANPPGFPQSWGAQLAEAQGYAKVVPVPADYEMDPKVVNDPRYQDALKDDLQSLPTLSLVMATSSLADLYSRSGGNWEERVSLEFIYPEISNSQDFQINAGLKLQDGLTPDDISKPSFRLLFKNEYGPTKLDYPLFPDSSVTKFDTLILRAASLDEPTAATQDHWLRASQNAMSGLSPHDISVHLYINGLYWGLYNVVERPDASFISDYVGGDKSDWFTANQAGPLNPDKGNAADPLNYLFTVLSFAGGGNSGLNQTDQLTQLYTTAASYLDPAQFSDYIILNWYAQAMNWPSTNWQIAINRQDLQGRGKVLVWNEPASGPAAAFQSSGVMSTSTGIDQALFEVLLQSPDFRMQLADRMYQHLFNAGPLTDAEAQTRWAHQNHALEGAIVGEIARWGDSRPKPPTQEEWLKAQDEMTQRMEGMAGRLIETAREAGYYPTLDPPIFSQEGGLVEVGFTLNMSLPKLSQDGAIYYTTDSSDPRMPVTGEVGPTAAAYNGPVVLAGNTTVKARVWDGQEWSALNQANFNVVAEDNKLRLTEVMYNPVEGDDLEFLELKNMGDTEVALANVSIIEGVSFIFPPNTPPLAPGQFAMLVSNSTAFAERYPHIPVAGVYDGHLSNKGEKITIVDEYEEALIEVEYNDEYGWPVSADGRGDSLVLLDPEGDPNDPQNWRASTRVGGSPGADEPAAQVSQPMN